ncbi:ProQ/FinO family protein [Lamprobacter modestohalophilus]|uniref:ProQ/FinO family protein n=1 Tax=Lamprobacter modestohalophilus TaxID=1064514 RepID=UPI002ADEED3F|nr:ProQ/FinO family protein [Lamprobacter modestohalophilus]MEA1052479.1 ProQ/FinO family protein [Lamprobacter modestohalophilus]
MTDPESTTSEPEQADPTTPRVLPERLEPEDLCARFPACFDLDNPRPLKLKIHKDLLAHYATELVFPETATKQQRSSTRWILRQRIKNAVARYCAKQDYLRATVEGAPRIALDGSTAGEVSTREATHATEVLSGASKPRKLPSTKPATAPASAPTFPKDAPLTEDAIVPGRLELTLKFNQLPKAVQIKDGMKIGIQTDNALVVATLRPKAWKKLTKANSDWPQWVAALSGTLGAQVPTDQGPAIILQEPNLQVFEKKPKPATD